MSNAIRVIFKVADCELFAAFPEYPGAFNAGTVVTYTYGGQYSSASVEYVRRARNATAAEIEPLRHDLEEMGYAELVRAYRITAADQRKRWDIIWSCQR